MGLNVNKLEKLLENHGFIIKRFFSIEGTLVYVEVFSIRQAEVFMMSLPMDLQIKAPESDRTSSFKLKKVVVDVGSDIVDKYADAPDRDKLERRYTELPDMYRDRERGEGVEKELEESYKKVIYLRELEEDNNNVKNIFRQLNRLKLCVQTIKYKLAILYKQFICIVTGQEEIECYFIKHYHPEDELARKLLVVCDLESFVTRPEVIQMNVQDVKAGVYRVLDKNQSKHTFNLKKMLSELTLVDRLSDKILAKKQDYSMHIDSYETLLSKLESKEKDILKKLRDIQSKNNDMFSDIGYIHAKSKLDSEFKTIETTRRDIITNLLKLKADMENIYLSTDKIEFDSTIMITDVIRNLEEFNQLAN